MILFSGREIIPWNDLCLHNSQVELNKFRVVEILFYTCEPSRYDLLSQINYRIRSGVCTRHRCTDTYTFLCQMFPIHSRRIFRSPCEYFICHAPETYLLNARIFSIYSTCIFSFLIS